MPRNNEEQLTASNPPRRFRFLRFLLISSIVIAVVLFLLPTILVNTSLKQYAINKATADLNGTVEIDSISAGWFSPVSLQSVILNDSQGQPVLAADEVQTSNTLFGFVTGGDYGSIKITRPEINLVTRADGSNLEDIFSNYTDVEPSGNESNAPMSLPKISVEIEEGLVQLSTAPIEGSHRLENLNALLQTNANEAPVVANIECSATAFNEPTAGHITAKVIVDEGQRDLLINQINAEVQTTDLAAAVLAPVLNRVLGPTNCVGDINCDFQFAANLNDFSTAANVRSFAARNVAIVAPDYLGQDQFSAATLSASGILNLSPNRVAAQQFKAESEFARVNANGEFDFEQLSNLAAGAAIPSSGFQLDGLLDLAQITTMLPQTMHLRDGVKLNSGLVQVQANTRNENGAPRMVVNVDAANMNMLVDGQNITWQKPLRLAIVAGKKQNALMLENIQLESDFLNASGSAALDRGQLKVSGDLQKLTNQIGQLVDLQGTQLAGKVAGNLVWQTDPEAAKLAASQGGTLPLDANGQFRIEKPDFRIPGYEPWKENAIDIAMIAKMNASTDGILAVNGARLDMTLGNEKAVAILNDPIANIAQAKKYQFQCQATGSLAKWLVQARHFAPMPEFFADGNLASQFVFTLNDKSCRVNKLQFKSTDFVLDGFGMNVREPEVSGRTNIKYDFETGLIEFSKTLIAGNGVKANSDQLVLNISEKILIDGEVTFRTGVNKASNWFGMSLPRDSMRWDGIATGSMKFDSTSGYLGGQLNSNIKDFVVVSLAQAVADQGTMQVASNQKRFEEIWREPTVQLASRIDLADDFNNLQFKDLNFHSKLAAIQGAGTLNDLAGQLITNFSGNWNLNWSNINQTMRDLIGDMATFQGEGWKPITVRGPLFAASTTATSSEAYIPEQLQASTSIAWTEATVMNVPLGQSDIGLIVDQSVAQLSSGAKEGLVNQVLQLKPLLDLRTANPMLVMGQGKILDHWNLTAEDSRTWIKFAAPLIADATSAEGQASIELEGANVPLFDPMKASARGQMEIHDLVVGAGPLAQQLLPMIDQIKAILRPGSSSIQDRQTWLKLNPQQIPIHVQEGRVYHEDFEMVYKDLTIKTRGSVGFDQTMNMVAEIPIQDDWINGNRALASLKGKSIPIPIQGTIGKPKLDRQSITRLTQQLVRDTAVNAAKDKVAGEFGKLQEKYGGKVQEELGRLQENAGGTLQEQIESKFKNEVQNGLKNLFGGDK